VSDPYQNPTTFEQRDTLPETQGTRESATEPVASPDAAGFFVSQHQEAIFIATTEGFAVNWRRLYVFHLQSSMDAARAPWRRRWHAKQARIIRGRHAVECSTGYSWSEHCRAAREQLEAEHFPLT
jgi:hypothetical protein